MTYGPTFDVEEREWLLKRIADLEAKEHKLTVDACQARASAIMHIEAGQRLVRQCADLTADCQRLQILADQRLETIIWLEEEVLR